MTAYQNDVTQAKAVEASRETRSLLNGGSSSIRFALYEESEPLRLLLNGKVDRVGIGGTNLSYAGALCDIPRTTRCSTALTEANTVEFRANPVRLYRTIAG
jgi:hypothetical protein